MWYCTFFPKNNNNINSNSKRQLLTICFDMFLNEEHHHNFHGKFCSIQALVLSLTFDLCKDTFINIYVTIINTSPKNLLDI